MRPSVIARLCLVAALAGASPRGSASVAVKILAQKRPDDLRRLLASLDGASYPADAVVSVEIHVDALPAATFWARPDAAAVAGRDEVVAAAKAWAATWPLGDATVVKAKKNKGIRRAWLDCYDPSISGEELGRVVILEDDVELSPAWYEFLAEATEAARGVPGVAAVSLQRQNSRLDAYARELGDSRAKASALAPLKLPADDGLYLFNHVGSWGLAPEPKVWEAFLEWMAALDDWDADRHFSVGADGTPYGARAPGYRESVVSRWYRGLVANGRGDSFGRSTTDSMWTAHFDAFCAARGLATLHARVNGNREAFATSYRADGAHYSGVNRADARLVSLAAWRGGLADRLVPADAPAAFPRVDLSGAVVAGPRADAARARFADHFGRSASPGWRPRFDRAVAAAAAAGPADPAARRLFELAVDLDVDWTRAGGWAAMTPEDPTPQLFGGLHHGYAPLDHVNQEQALCVLRGKRTAIVGDSITRYFAFTLNYYLKTGEIIPELSRVGKWGGAKRQDDGFWRGSEYFDQGNIWTDGVYSTRADHRQWITQDLADDDVFTSFWFIQETWYPPLADLSAELKGDYDVLVINSGWWDIQNAPGCTNELMYQNGQCLKDYEAQLGAMASQLLAGFDGRGKAGMFRTSNCCGGTSTNNAKRRAGAIAVASMNAVASELFSGRGVETMDVEDTANIANVGNGNGDPDGRSFDGGHPRAAIYHLWVQLFLNKAARQLGRESCFATAEPTPRPTTPRPTERPTPKPTVPEGSPCLNGIRDGAETDVDCGGDECSPCAAGRACVVEADCDAALDCVGGVCVAEPSPRPTAIPTFEPTAAPTDREPRPTFKPFQPTPGGGDDDNDDDGYDGPPVRPTLGACGNFSGNDGISYRRDGNLIALQSELFDVCPSSGQRLLLALGLGVIVATLVALSLARRRRPKAYRAWEPTGDKKPMKEETKEKEPSPPKAAKKENIEAELSGAALHVLKQMERRDVKGAPTLDKITEDAPLDDASRRQSGLAAAGRPAARTSESRFSQHVSLGAGSVRQRTSRYSEYRAGGGGAPATVSSVAFSLYDGGDSDDSEAEDEPAAAGDAEAPPPPPARRIGAKTVAACLAACQLGAVLALAEIGDSRMPAGYIPAGTLTAPENMDLWTFIMLSLAFASLWCLRSVSSERDPLSACFLSRAQANEWKGWMQVAFVAYHYANAQDVYVPIRWAVSAYVWLTGFGNGVYFWASADFSLKRFVQQLFRMNFLCALLALATNTAWIDYYFVALATVHFVLIFLCLGAARLLGMFIFKSWPTPDRKLGREACDAEKAVGWIMLVVVTCLLWVPPQLPNMQRSSASKTPYDYVFQTWLKDINHHTANYFWTRTRMDYLSSIHGLLFAAVYARFRDWWPRASVAARAPLYVVAAAALGVAIWVAKLKVYCCNGGAEYQHINAYIGTLWIPFYLLCRNATPWLMDRVAAPMEWIGMHSLEFYLLQFHVFMTRKSQKVLYIIPNETWSYTNMVLVGFIYVLMCVKSLELTNVLRSVVWRATRLKVAAATLWCVAFYALYEGYFKNTSHPCSALSWGVWWAFAALATGLLVAWTVLDLKKA